MRKYAEKNRCPQHPYQTPAGGNMCLTGIFSFWIPLASSAKPGLKNDEVWTHFIDCSPGDESKSVMEH